MYRITVCVLAIALGTISAVFAASYSIKPFIGTYEGEALSDTRGGQISKRDINVEIKPFKRSGFTVDWMTIRHKSDGELSRKKYSISFEPTKRPGIYSSAMRTNMFGDEVPHDPLKGDPLVWAKIEGESLIVYVMIITEEGGYEMQTYRRTLTDVGMQLEFSRVGDGKPLRIVTGELKRTSE